MTKRFSIRFHRAALVVKYSKLQSCSEFGMKAKIPHKNVKDTVLKMILCFTLQC